MKKPCFLRTIEFNQQRIVTKFKISLRKFMKINKMPYKKPYF